MKSLVESINESVINENIVDDVIKTFNKASNFFTNYDKKYGDETLSFVDKNGNSHIKLSQDDHIRSTVCQFITCDGKLFGGRRILPSADELITFIKKCNPKTSLELNKFVMDIGLRLSNAFEPYNPLKPILIGDFDMRLIANKSIMAYTLKDKLVNNKKYMENLGYDKWLDYYDITVDEIPDYSKFFEFCERLENRLP